MAQTSSGQTVSQYKKPPTSITPTLVVSSTSTRALPPRTPNPNVKTPVEAIKSTPASRSGSLGTSDTLVVGQPIDQSGITSRKATFTAANQTDSVGASALSAAEKQKNLDAVAARKSGIMGCLGKTQSTTSGCNGTCDTVNCLTDLLTGNLLDVDAKKMLCDTINATERALKRQIDSTGDQLLNAAQTMTSLAPVIAPLNALQSMVNKLDPGAVAKCFGAQALKDKVNGQFNKAKNTVKNFQNGYQDKIAEKFNSATEAAQQFSAAPSACSNPSPASLRSLLG